MCAEEDRIIADARQLGIVDEDKVRNLNIYNAFSSMRGNGMKYEDAIYKLHMQFFLSEDRIRRIITEVGKQKNKNKQH